MVDRERHCSSDHAGLAQAYVSFGKAYVSLGRVEANCAPPPASKEGAPTAEDGKPNLSREALEWWGKADGDGEVADRVQDRVQREPPQGGARAQASPSFEEASTRSEQQLDDAIRIRRSVQDSLLRARPELDALSLARSRCSSRSPGRASCKRKWRSVIGYVLGRTTMTSARQRRPPLPASAQPQPRRGTSLLAPRRPSSPRRGGAKMSSALSPKRPGLRPHCEARPRRAVCRRRRRPAQPTHGRPPRPSALPAASPLSSDSAALEVVNEEPQNDGDAER